MKYAGALVLLMSVIGIATFENAVPGDGREWAARLVRYAMYALFVGGLYLFGAGLKREIVTDLRARSAHPHGDQSTDGGGAG